MPKDSLHPDAKLTHEVIVERWLTNEEYATLLEERKLAWQSKEDELTDKEGDMNVDGVGSVTETSEVEEVRFFFFLSSCYNRVAPSEFRALISFALVVRRSLQSQKDSTQPTTEPHSVLTSPSLFSALTIHLLFSLVHLL